MTSFVELEQSRLRLVESLRYRPNALSTQQQFIAFFSAPVALADKKRMKSFCLEFQGWLPMLSDGWLDVGWPPEEYDRLYAILKVFSDFAESFPGEQVWQRARTAQALAWLYLGEPEKASALLGYSPVFIEHGLSEKSKASAWHKANEPFVHPDLGLRLRSWINESGSYSGESIRVVLVEEPAATSDRGGIGILLPLTGHLRERPGDAEEDRVLFTNHLPEPGNPVSWSCLDGLAAARALLPYSIMAKTFYAMQLSLPEKQAHYSGTSMGLACGVLSYALMMNRFYRSEMVKISIRVGLTGGIGADGRVAAIDAASLRAKIRAAFFSPLQRVLVPANNLAEAAKVIDELKTLYPHRHLVIEGVETLAQAIENRNLIQRQNVTPLRRSIAAFRRAPVSYLSWIVPMVISMALVVFILTGIAGSVKPGAPANFMVEGTELRILDAGNKPVWTHDFGTALEKKHYNPAAMHNIVIQDIDDDGRKETLFGAYEVNDAQFSGGVWLFDEKGHVVWKHQAGRALSAGSHIYPNHFRIHYLAVRDVNADGENEILVSAWHFPYWPNLIQILDLRGKVLGEYWHVGYCNVIEFQDINGDGKEEILLGGQNNEYKSAVLVVLDGASMSGCSPQTPGSGYYPDSLQACAHLHYLRFPVTEFVRLGQRDQVGWIEKGAEITVVITNAYPQLHWGLNLPFNPGMVYYVLDGEMKLKQPPAFGDIYKTLVSNHLGYSLEARAQTQYQQIQYWRDGTWVK